MPVLSLNIKRIVTLYIQPAVYKHIFFPLQHIDSTLDIRYVTSELAIRYNVQQTLDAEGRNSVDSVWKLFKY